MAAEMHIGVGGGVTMKKESPSRHDGEFRRATYYLRPDQIRGLKMCAVLEDRRLSDVLRDAVDRYLEVCAPARSAGR
jgi:hypothetical protein